MKEVLEKRSKKKKKDNGHEIYKKQGVPTHTTRR